MAIPKRSLVGAASLVALAAVLSRLLGYVREVLLAAKFGATTITDAYLVAQEIPGAIYSVVSASLVLAFIPVYQQVRQREGAGPAWRLVNTMLNVTVIGFALLGVLVGVGAPVLIRLMAPGFPAEVAALSTGLLRAMLPMFLVIGVTGLTAAVLNAHQRFGPPAFFALMTNVVVVGTLAVVSRPDQILWVAFAVVGGHLLGTLVQVAAMPSLEYRYQPVLDLGAPAFRRVWRLLLPLMVATSVIQVQTLTSRIFASHLAEGSISFLNYAARVSALPFSVVGLAVTTVLFPTLAEHGAAGRIEDLRQSLRSGLRTLAFLLVPMAVGCLVFAEPIVRLIFERGAFTPGDTRATAYALQFFSLGILFSGWLDLLNRAFYAVQESVTPMWVALVMMGSNLALNALLVDVMGHGGLALAGSLSLLLGDLLLMGRLRVRLGAIGGLDLLRPLLSYTVTSLLGAAAGWWLLRIGSGFAAGGVLQEALLLLIALGLILVVHVGAAVLLKTPDGDEIRRVTARLLRKRA